MRHIITGRAQCSRRTSLQAEKNAKSIVRELEDAKLAGIDYPVSSLINLRQVGPLEATQSMWHRASFWALAFRPLSVTCPHLPRTNAQLALFPLTMSSREVPPRSSPDAASSTCNGQSPERRW